ncbi:hypothetical protein HUJ04_004069 [Dendroctonus ponderosae]|nr:hypothetical protein HUJ04_004069 [Dendroctonus ponderosae]
MQASEESALTVVEPNGDSYADANLNEKNLGTKYIYTTEGQLIPADEDHNTSTMDLNAQHYNSHHVTAPQTVNIHQVDFQFEQQYPEGTGHVVSVNTDFVQNPSNSFVLEPAEYGPETAEPVPNVGQIYSVESQSISCEYSRPVEDADGQMSDEHQPDGSSTPVKGDSTAPGLQTPHQLNEQEAAEGQTEPQVTVEPVSDKSSENSQPNLEVSDAKEEPSAMDEDETHIQSLKSNPAIEVQLDESVDEDKPKIDDSDSFQTSGEEIITLEHKIEDEEIEILEEIAVTKVKEEEATVSEKPSPRPRGRKLKTDIPLHILGHDVNKPMDNILNGKSPKPSVLRVGVRVPYRNLTSQIVSKKEIEEEILERGKKKRTEKKDATFAQQLTSRLAKRIVEADESAKTSKIAKTQEEPVSQESDLEVDKNASGPEPKASLDNIDLLAILEGDGDPDPTTIVSEKVQDKETTLTDETNLKNLEREIALQQLHDLPFLTPKPKLLKGSKFKVYSKGSLTGQKTAELPSTEKPASVTKLQSVKNNISMSRLEVNKPVKVIWDPDEASSKAKVQGSKVEATPPKTLQSPKAVQPKNENKSAEPAKKAAEIKAKPDKKAEEKRLVKRASIVEKKVSPSPKQLQKVKKPRTEVDKLLGDEGAIKMLYDLKNSENSGEERRKKTVFSVEKTFKDLAKKANQIKTDLVNTSASETPKVLRRKDGFPSSANQKSALAAAAPTVATPGPISRQKSKDSARSSPPASPSFPYPNEVSYLIRRRSSSSISSTAEDTGESVDLDVSEEPKKKPVAPLSDPLEVKLAKKSPELAKAQKRLENRMGTYNTFTLKKINNSVTIELYTTDKPFYFTSELLGELTAALGKISEENDCQVVLIKSSSAKVFSRGIDYKFLVSDKENIRLQKAKELASQVKAFLHCLMGFPKVLVAGIQGECAGVAVTILPLFDIVIASDDAQFSTSYSALGCVAEGAFLLTVPHVSSYGLAGELLLASQKLTADEAYRRGLISKLCWPEKYQDTVKATVAAVAQGSIQSLEATKKNLRLNVRAGFEQSIDSMELELIEHWISMDRNS